MSSALNARVRERRLLRGDTSSKPLEWTGLRRCPASDLMWLPATQGQRSKDQNLKGACDRNFYQIIAESLEA
jgi:hypothetical protein